MTEDVDFYVELAREAEGPVVELAVGTGASRSRSRANRKARDRDRLVARDARASRASARTRPASSSSCTKRDMRDLDLEAGDRSRHLPVPRAPPPADLGRPAPRLRARRRVRFDRAGASPGTRSSSTIASPPRATGSGRTSRCDISRRTRRATTASTSRSRTARRSRSGGSRAPSGKGSWTSSGLEMEALYGWFDRRPFDDSSREFVWVARKPG